MSRAMSRAPSWTVRNILRAGQFGQQRDFGVQTPQYLPAGHGAGTVGGHATLALILTETTMAFFGFLFTSLEGGTFRVAPHAT